MLRKIAHKKTHASGDVGFILGDPVGIRTPNLRIRSAMLYPVELQGLVVSQVPNGGQR